MKIFIFIIPLVLITGANIGSVLQESGSINEPQEAAVLSQPLFAIKYLGYPLFFLLFLIPIHYYFTRPEGFDILILIWITSIIPMALFFPDRLIQYVAQPLAIIGAITLSQITQGTRTRLVLFTALLLFSVSLQINLFIILVENGGVELPLFNLSPYAI